jgi:hypothetical protein
VKDNRTYHIKVKARNDCGVTDFSDILRATISLVPPPPPSFIVDDKDCGVKISWESPDNRGAEINAYSI